MTISWPAGTGRSGTILVLGVLLGLAATSAFALSVTRGPYLQMGDDDSIVIRWRTDMPSNSRVRYGTSVLTLSERATQGGNRTEHEIQITGLLPGTRYFYSVGSSGQVLAGGDPTHFFDTAPPPGTPQTMRIWVLGDSGTADANAAAVRDAYLTYTGNLSPDLMLMLGDNAYLSGTDSQYQAALFDMYPQVLRNAVLWPTLGNHDGNSSTSSDESGPYFDMFTLPRMGEVGGVASGTEAYYSFDYANVHFVVLDSQGSLRTAGSPMLAWLQNDLAMTPQDWIIAYWHHPPYSKGNHDSDNETLEFQLVEMRENAVQILESFGVDLVLAGHSHSYERSFLIDGHYGESDTFGPEHVVDGGDGRETGDGAYAKPLYGGRQGAVYTVAGSSGKTTGGSLDHPAMFVSLNELGSVILDIAADTLDATFLNSTGDVRDSFTLIKSSEAVVEFSAVPSSGSAPLAVEFTDESFVTATAWAWDFENDGTIDSSDQHPTAVYELPGTYSVKLTITATPGVFERVKNDFVVASLDPPLAEFTSNVQIGVVPLTVDFTDFSTRIPASWEWDFDNDLNIDSTVQDPSWIFTEPGSYTVTLRVSNPAGSTTEIKTDFIVVTPLVPGEITNLLFDTDPAVFFWDARLDACSYDVVKGDLVQLRSGNGQFETAQLGCAAQETPVAAAEDASIPAPGEAFFYVVRGVTCSSDAGTYDTSNPFQSQSRDLPLQGPTAACGCNPASDFDNDGFCDPYDLCPTLANVDQTDQDGDGFGDACDCDPLSTRCTTDCTDADADSYCLTSDCDDQSSETFPGAAPNDDPAACMADVDQDDWGDAIPLPLVTVGTDCDDTQAAVNPASTWYADFDNDGFGDPNTSIVQCEQPASWVLEATDCDGTRADTFPGAAPADDPGACMKDADGDGWGDSAPSAGVTPGSDCDDDSTSAASAFPGAAPNDDPAACMKDVDDDDWGDDTPPAGVAPGTDCDDVDPELTPASAWYADTDGDGFGDLFVSLVQCVPPAGHVADSTDCDDVTVSAAVTFPGAAPSDDALACMKDADGDDWGDSAPLPGVAPGSDCDDDDADRGPNSVWFADADADTFGDVNSMLVQCEQPAGYVFDNTDCDDSSPTAASAFPGAAPNDNPSACMKDADGDEWGDAAPPPGVSAGTDCDDDSALAGVTFPGAAPNDGPDCLLDADADGWGDATPPPGVPSGTDCNDADAAIHPDTVWYQDQDLDGFGDVAVSLVQCEQPAGHLLDSTDCDDASPTAASTFRGAAPGDSALACMKDVDGDDFGDSSPPAGVIPGSDCDDDDAAANIHTPWYADTDGDGFGDPAALTESCIAPAAHVSNTDDCDDTSPTAAAAFPGAAPNDSATACLKDADGDGWGDDGPPEGVTPGSDCDDDAPTAASTFPGAAPSDNVSACMKDVDGDDWGDLAPPAGVTPGTDCNDADDSLTPQSRWYADSDGDGYGSLFVSLTQCDEPAGYVIDSTDCDDLSASATTTFPGAAPNDDSFVCMKDTDSDDWGDDSPPAGVVPGSDCADDDPDRGPTTVWFSDADGDGFGNVGLMLVQCDQPAGYIFDNSDCDDLSATAASAFPGAAPNDGPSCMKDVDGDDWGDLAPPAGVGTGTDCDDDSPGAASTFPGAAPSDGPGCLLDADDDDWGDDSPPGGVPSGTDCDDADAEIHPATNWYRDLDLDGFGDVAEPLTQCEQPAGYLLDSTDCDDTSPTAASTFPGAAPNDSDVTCMKDSDGDDWGDLSPIAGVTAGSDCDDADSTRNPTTVWFADGDGDGFGDAAITLVQCAQPAAHVLDNADCDDTSATAASTFPGAAPNDSGSACMKDVDGDGYGDLAPPPGVTNGSDCDDSDQILNPATRWYADNDGDAFGDPNDELVQCLQPAGYLLDSTDCDDLSASAASTYPGAAPNDGAGVCLKDVDGDEWGDATPPPGVPVGGDCDDSDAVLNPATFWHADADFDGFGDVADKRQQCPQPPGFVLDATDCDDASATAASTFPGAAPAETNGSACMRDVDDDDYGDVSPPGGVVAGTDCADGDVFSNPGAPEVCDGNDNNCDTTVPLDEIDNDGDFFVECTGWNDTQNDSPSVAGGDDCDDTSATAAVTFPGAAPAETNGSACMRDVDGDDYGDATPPGSVTAGTDCDDTDVTSNPTAFERCDGNDNDCDTIVPANEIDDDGDLYVVCTSWSDSQADQPTIVGGDDCDDISPTAAATFPGAAPNEPNGSACMRDVDGDDYGDTAPPGGVVAGTDCADGDVTSNPGAAELCDGNDNNCDTTVPAVETDDDGDFFVECTAWSDSQNDQPAIAGGDDCDDTSATAAATFPGAAPAETNGSACMRDVDGDDYGDTAPPGGVVAGTDCADGDVTSNPGAAELCDGNDNNCDTTVPAVETDDDGDFFVECTAWSDSQNDQPAIAGGDDCDDTSATAAATFPGAAPAETNGSACMRDVDSDDYGDASPPGGVTAGTDCDDTDVTSNPTSFEMCDGNDNNCDTVVPANEIDADGDLYVECSTWSDTQGDQPTIVGGADCDDLSATAAATFPGAAPNEANGSACMRDVDGDDYGDATPPGGVETGTDCADADPTSRPGAAELCDGNDNDCDTVVPADEIDDDGDLYVECTSWSDSQGDQPTIDGGDDCDDGDSTSRPGAAELCDGNDNDCDTVIPADEIDDDGDLYVECTGWNDTQGDQLTIDGGDDCDDADSASKPGGTEVCDGNDNDCDTTVPLDEIDNDGDLYVECTGWDDTQGDQLTIDGGDDCDDADSASNPGASEVCDGNDNDCDTVVPLDEIDNDGDLYVECTGWNDTQSDQLTIDGGDDCDDADSASKPGASEVCDGNDNDCDTVVPLDEIDNDGDLYVECTGWDDTQSDQLTIDGGGDCDDADSASKPGASEVCDGNDNDCDTVVPLTEIDNDGDLYVECTGWNDTQGDQLTIDGGDDCDDADSASKPGGTEVCDGNDNDCDTVVPLDEIDNDGDFYVECTGWNDTQGDQLTIDGGDDCDDTLSGINPGATEIVGNGTDEDCNGFDTVRCYADVDGDLFGDSSDAGTLDPDGTCDAGSVLDNTDCDDADSASKPGGTEVCDGNDNDCDTVVPLDEIDNDDDFYVECTGWNDTQGDQLTIVGGDDCDDTLSGINPGATEIVGNGTDEDCNGFDTVRCYADVDGDLFGDSSDAGTLDPDGTCDAGSVLDNTDCDDADSASKPGASEVCDGNDNDCDTVVPLDEIDNDGDLYVECTGWDDTQSDQLTILGGGDCDDADSASKPGGTEVCDGNDNDCDTVVPLDEIDNDGDFYVECTGWNDTQGDQETIVGGDDCDDTLSGINPGATEIVGNGTDEDCNGFDTVRCYTDGDGDTFGDSADTGTLDADGTCDSGKVLDNTDCDDADSASKPGGTEVCDGNDNDCDTVVPLDEIDNDGDFYVECTGWNDTQSDQLTIVGGDDCDDTLSGINPGATEIVGNGTDEDCNGFDTVRCYTDGDGDTFGDSADAGTLDADGSCDTGKVLDNTDCDDADSASKPGGTEVCDGNDNDCDTVVPLDEIDNDGDFYVECTGWNDTQSDQGTIVGGDDCDDTDSASKPGGTEVCDGNDNDCDTVVPLDEIDNDGDFYVECTGWNDTQSDQGTIVGGDDCDGTLSGINPGATEIVGNGTDEDCNGFDTVRCYTDGDGDTFGDSADAGTLDADGSCDTGKVLDNTDCDDADSASKPGGTEVCDGNDNDCDTVVPLDEIDNDGDFYVECEPWSDTQSDQLTILGGGDCDDTDSASKPGASEVCDGNDNDCDTVVPLDEIDNDGDFYVECTGWNDTQGDQETIVGGDDCDDTLSGINPGATEIVGNGTDEDCNGFDTVRCYTDGDGDTFGDSADAGTLDADGSCDTGKVLDNTDCADADSASKPGGTEVCDGNDNDCDTVVPLDEIDNDGDFYVECEPWSDTQSDQLTILGGGDCDDADSASKPGGTEVCDGNDNDCDTVVPLDEIDNDGDFYVECTGWNDTQSDQGTIVGGDDCDDTLSGINPGATEIVGNGTDEDCNGFDTVRCYTDGDGDTFGDSADAGTLDADGSCDTGKVLDNTDCDDTDSASKPGASEVCDGNDNDCDTVVPLDEIDNDGDFYVECTGWNDTQSDQLTIVGGDDCDDTLSGINPGATEIVGNGTDEDCNGFDTVRCYTDGDGDTFGDSADTGTLDADGTCDSGKVLDNTDCDDADSASKPGGTEVCDGNDNDCDTVVPLDEIDNDGDFYVECTGWNDTQSDQGTIVGGDDCDDTLSGINPGATEIVGNGTDEDCNGFDTVRCYTDGDGDTFGDSADAGTLDADGSCDTGKVLDNTDCDDADSASKPGGTEVCDGNDNDCDTVVPLDEIDNDGDFYVECTGWNDTQSDQLTIVGGDDCDDTLSGINPGATEIVGNGTDEDCNGFDTVRCYTDADGDTFGDSADAGTLDADGTCDSGKVLDNTDCDDTGSTAASIFPGAAPNETNGAACMEDVDDDGYGDETPPAGVTPGTDCNDADAGVYPGFNC